MNNLGRWSGLILGGIVAIAPALQARTCTGNGDLIGGYAWVGSRSRNFVPPPVDPAVTPITGSATAIGALASGAANSSSFGLVGRVFLDGNGGIFASSDSTTPLLQVGKYTANTDCTISVSITDAFATPAGAFLTPIQATASFEGFIVQNGNEIALVQTGTTGGATLNLQKTKQFNACSTDILAGTFGVSSTAVSTVAALATATTPATTTPVVTPFNLYGRLVADGNGNFIQDSFGLLSPLVARQLTGTYIVNSDCTGTGTLIGSDLKSRKINFAVVGSGSGSSGTIGLVFAYADSGVVGTGLAQQQ